jgi:16S rRNA G966 N2-methylase RsmD
VVSMATAKTLLGTSIPRHKDKVVSAPVAFQCGKADFILPRGDSNNVIWAGHEIPRHILKDCEHRNVAYRIEAACGSYTPLFKTLEDSTMLKISEPNVDHSCRGPVLNVGGMKMHVSKGFTDTRDFSRLFARGCGRGKIRSKALDNMNVLDLFFGLGISTGECLAMGAKSVTAFERPYFQDIQNFVHSLCTPVAGVSRDRPLLPVSPNHDQVLLRMCDVGKGSPSDVFDILEGDGTMFDAVILDPPKRLVMQKVYSKPFLDRLAQFINPGAIISCYAPDLDHSDVDSWSKEFLSTFLEGGYFRMVQAESPHVHITRFRRL